MKLLGLPGIRPVTGPWLQQLTAAVNLGQSETIIQSYECWNNPGISFNLAAEAMNAENYQPGIIIAKSIGTRVAIQAFKNNRLETEYFVFIGTPIEALSQEEIHLINNLCKAVPVLLIQQTNDPLGSYTMLTSIITGKSGCQISEVPGNDHKYDQIDFLAQIIQSWFQQVSGTLS